MISLIVATALAAGAGEATAPHCLRARANLHAGLMAASKDFAPASCPQVLPAPAFRHEAMQGGSIISRPVAEGEIVRAFPEYGLAMVQPGEKLRLLLAIGATRIERDVEALQAARPGQHLFVRTGDGRILSVRYEVTR